MSYATLAEFKSAIGIGTADVTDDTALQSVLDATDALIDLYTDRKNGFGTATETRYYTLAPGNAALDGWPYNEIDVSVTWPRNFPRDVYRGVKVVGVFGWPSVPSAVKQAAIIQAGAVWSSRTSPFGVIGSQDLGGILRQARALHPESQVLLEAYRRREGLAR